MPSKDLFPALLSKAGIRTYQGFIGLVKKNLSNEFASFYLQLFLDVLDIIDKTAVGSIDRIRAKDEYTKRNNIEGYSRILDHLETCEVGSGQPDLFKVLILKCLLNLSKEEKEWLAERYTYISTADRTQSKYSDDVISYCKLRYDAPIKKILITVSEAEFRTIIVSIISPATLTTKTTEESRDITGRLIDRPLSLAQRKTHDVKPQRTGKRKKDAKDQKLSVQVYEHLEKLKNEIDLFIDNLKDEIFSFFKSIERPKVKSSYSSELSLGIKDITDLAGGLLSGIKEISSLKGIISVIKVVDQFFSKLSSRKVIKTISIAGFTKENLEQQLELNTIKKQIKDIVATFGTLDIKQIDIYKRAFEDLNNKDKELIYYLSYFDWFLFNLYYRFVGIYFECFLDLISEGPITIKSALILNVYNEDYSFVRDRLERIIEKTKKSAPLGVWWFNWYYRLTGKWPLSGQERTFYRISYKYFNVEKQGNDEIIFQIPTNKQFSTIDVFPKVLKGSLERFAEYMTKTTNPPEKTKWNDIFLQTTEDIPPLPFIDKLPGNDFTIEYREIETKL